MILLYYKRQHFSFKKNKFLLYLKIKFMLQLFCDEVKFYNISIFLKNENKYKI